MVCWFLLPILQICGTSGKKSIKIETLRKRLFPRGQDKYEHDTLEKTKKNIIVETYIMAV